MKPQEQRKRIPQVELCDPYCLRLSPALADEIGVNESMIFLQIEYLISISDAERDGRVWAYQSIRQLRERFFPWLSTGTISKAIHRLETLELLTVSNYNSAPYDRTQWFSINADGVNKCKSINMFILETPYVQNMNMDVQKLNRGVSRMNDYTETTIETTEKTTEEIGASRGKPRSASTKSKSSKPVLTDEEYLTSLEQNPAYEGIDIRRLYGHMCNWCELKGKKPTRMRLLNWLSRQDKPMATANGAKPNGTNQTGFEANSKTRAGNFAATHDYYAARLSNGPATVRDIDGDPEPEGVPGAAGLARTGTGKGT